MSIIVQYGNYVHAAGEVEYAINKTAKVSDRGFPVAELVTVDMEGMLFSDSPSAMDAKVVALKAAYAKNNQDWRVVADGISLAISVAASETIGGINVTVPPMFPSNASAAYVTLLKYRMQLQWEVPITDQFYALKSFSETLTFSGGGPRFGHMEVALGLPVKQKLRANTIFRVTQQGSAVGFYATPVVPDPLWTDALVEYNPERTVATGITKGPIGEPLRTDIPVTWKYVYESATSLSGRPNFWGLTS